jgi:bifunctional UDP-N-acetylglucosamine pyrophosphorylase / glucosamine-1-phosphate N-acetyltransferase
MGAFRVVADVAAIVLAAGQSKRMRSDLPKVLHCALGQPLVGYAVQAARSAGATRIVVVVRPEHRELVAQALAGLDEVSLAIQAEAKGTAHAVLAAKEALAGFTGTGLVLLGDAPCVSSHSLETLVKEHAARSATLSVLTGEVTNPTGYGRIVRGPDGDLAAIVEEKDASDAIKAHREINSGVMALELPRVWSILEKIQPSPRTGELYLTDAIELTRSGGAGKVHAVRAAAEEDVLGVNDRVQLAQVTAILRRRINERHMKNGVTIVDPASTFIDARAELEHDVTIEPFTVIEGPCRLARGARVGPFTRLRGGSKVEAGAIVGNFVEVVRSEVGPRSRALHLSFLGDARLGADVNVGAGAITANWDGEAHHRTTVQDGASVGAGSVAVAPVTIGAKATIGAGAVVLDEVPAGETWVGVPARAVDRIKAREQA